MTGQFRVIGGFYSPSNKQHDSFLTRSLYATLDVIWIKDEVHVLQKLDFIMMPHTSVDRRRDALIIGDDSCSALLLCARMFSLTKLPKIMEYAGNMPKREIYFGLLYGGDTMETRGKFHNNNR